MPSTINATSTGSGGLISTGDASGQLELQANGSTKLTVSSSGVSFTGGIASPLEVTGNSTAGAEIRLPEDTDNGTNYVALKAANSIASNVTFTLPSADGTSGQVLQTNGSGTLSFVTPAGGSWTYLSTVTASNSATVDVETTFDSTYDTYAIIISGFVPSLNSNSIWVRLKVGGSYRSAAGYRYFVTYLNSAVGGSGGFDSSATPSAAEQIIISDSIGNTAGYSYSAVLYVPVPASTSLWKMIYGQGSGVKTDGTITQSNFAGMWNSTSATSALTGVRFLFGSGNIASGSARLYGIKNS